MLVGIFIGGKATRMGGLAKGLSINASGSTLVAHSAAVARQALPNAQVVLAGTHAAYAHLPFDQIADDPAGSGPLAGLHALLRHAKSDAVIALACDLPLITVELIERLSVHAPEAAAVAPKLGEHWQPLCARYRVAPCAAVAAALLADPNPRGPRHLLQQLGASAMALPVSADEQHLLQDWDTPEQVQRGGGQLPNTQ